MKVEAGLCSLVEKGAEPDSTQISPSLSSSAKTKSASTSNIGWNPGAFGADPATDTTSNDDDNRSNPSTTATSASKWAPTINAKVEVKDFQTKAFRRAVVTNMDEELGTVCVQYLDDDKMGNGIPCGMCREIVGGGGNEESKEEKRRRKKEKKERKEKNANSAASEPAAAGAASPAPAPSASNVSPEDKKIKEINAILNSFTLKELDSTLTIIKALNSIVLGKL